MSEGACGQSTTRIRIKGRWRSVLRFFFIAVGFMMPWVLITSLLNYYAKWFGPQILLQLNFAFYLPSIPVLLVSGQLEKALDAQFGPIASMMLRLNAGLAGGGLICAAFPFISKSHSALLWIVALLGTLSAIAFSTSYQLVQWFRHADIIGLGIGGVGSGPLVLAIQLGLVYVKTWPERWQWIAMFEISAAIVLLGLLSSLSLFGQYWDVLTGAQPYEDLRKPLLADGSAEDEERPALPGSTDNALVQARTAPTTPRRAAPPRSRSQGLLRWCSPSVELLSPEEQQQERRIALRMAPTANVLLAPDPFGGLPVIFREPSNGELSAYTVASPAPVLRRSAAEAAAASPSYPWGDHEVGNGRPRSASADDGVTARSQAGTRRQGPGAVATPAAVSAAAAAGRGAGVGVSPFAAEGVQAAGEAGEAAARVAAAAGESAAGKLGSAGRQGHQGVDGHGAADVGVGSQGGEKAGLELSGGGGAEAKPEALTLWQETGAAVARIWPVLCAFLISVSILYLVFPFFTYVPGGSLLGDAMPRVLFFTRIGGDIVGRFAPRAKALVTRSPSVLFGLALIKVVAAALLIAYVKTPPAWHHDMLPVLIVIFLWTAGGYVNTCANILAPALVPDHLCARASALMALTFQVAHFLGLLLAAGIVFVMFGDLAG